MSPDNVYVRKIYCCDKDQRVLGTSLCLEKKSNKLNAKQNRISVYCDDFQISNHDMHLENFSVKSFSVHRADRITTSNYSHFFSYS